MKCPSVALIVLCLFVGFCAFGAESKKGKSAKTKPLPDRYNQFKLGMSAKTVERIATPIYQTELSPGLRMMAVNVKSNEVDAVALGLWKDKLASIVLVFQPGYTVESVKPNLAKTYGEPIKDDEEGVVWADESHIMKLKQEFNILEKPNRLTLTYADLATYDEIKQGKFPNRRPEPGPEKGNKDDAPK